MANFEGPCSAWRKSTASNSGGCLEVAVLNGSVLVRDSVNRAGAVLTLSPAAWSDLLARTRGKDPRFPGSPNSTSLTSRRLQEARRQVEYPP